MIKEYLQMKSIWISNAADVPNPFVDSVNPMTASPEGPQPDDYGSAAERAELHESLRRSVREICERFPDAYWRKLDAERAYPEEFVRALTEAGFLSALIPEQYGGAGLGIAEASIILEEVNRSGATPAPAMPRCTSWGRCFGTAATRRSSGTFRTSPAVRLRLQAFAVSEPTTGSDTTQMKTMAVRKGDGVRGDRPEGVDLARGAFRPDAADGADDAARAGGQAQRRAVDAARGHAVGRRPWPDHPSDSHDDESRDHRVVLRRPRSAGREPDRRRGQGIPLPARRPQRRADSHCRGVRRRRPMVHRARDRGTRRTGACSAARLARIRACSFRSRARTSTSKRQI